MARSPLFRLAVAVLAGAAAAALASGAMGARYVPPIGWITGSTQPPLVPVANKLPGSIVATRSEASQKTVGQSLVERPLGWAREHQAARTGREAPGSHSLRRSQAQPNPRKTTGAKVAPPTIRKRGTANGRTSQTIRALDAKKKLWCPAPLQTNTSSRHQGPGGQSEPQNTRALDLPPENTPPTPGL